MPNKLLVVIGGPTGTGKTDMAIRLALHYHSEIVSADSRQIYKELIIGVGRPAPEQLTMVPHHLIGHVSIFEPYSAGHYLKDALRVLDQLFTAHDIVFLTGGTGLYVKSIMEGFDDIPEIPEAFTDRWTAFWKTHGTDALVQSLKQYDPSYLTTVDTANPMRLIRALAVTEASGQPFSSFRKGTVAHRPFQILPIVLQRPREELYARINHRVLGMMDRGWLDEARELFPYRHLKALQTVGYKELFEHLEGKYTLPDAIAAIRQSTRRYAKRQMTWWRHQGAWIAYHAEDIDGIKEAIQRMQ